MRIEPFRLINFDSAYWQKNDLFDLLNNTNTVGKAEKTKRIIEFLTSKIKSGEAKKDSEAGFYVLNVKDKNKDVTSIICSMDYAENQSFFPNEKIHEDKLSVYQDLLKAYKLQTNPVLTFYRGNISIRELTDFSNAKPPKIDVNIHGTDYKLWKISDQRHMSFIKDNIAKVQKIYIADGHHRFSLFQSVSRKTNAKIMISLTDAESVCLKSCHKAVTGKLDPNWLEKLKKYATVEESFEGDLSDGINMIQRGGRVFKVKLQNAIIEKMQLYKAVMQIVIEESLGVCDKSKVFPLPGSVGIQDYQKIFDLYQDCSMLVFVPEIDITEFFKVVDKGEKLPPSSTWFEPKLVDGFLMKEFG